MIAEGLKWAKKGSFTLTDQALFSGGNFVINILLARWLPPAEYGAYSLAYVVFLLFAAIHSAILVEPMMVFGAGKYASRFPRYLRALLCGHLALMAPASVILLGVAYGLKRLYPPEAQHAFLGLVLGATAILLFWLVRRTFYVVLDPARAAVGGGVYFLLIVASVCVLRLAGILSTFTAFLGMAFASLLASVLMLAFFLPVWKAGGDSPSFSAAARDHWRYGRWAMCTAAIGWFPGQVYYALLPARLGLEGPGALRALMNFVMPVLQAISALTLLLLPLLVRDRDRGGTKRMTRTMLIFLALFLLAAVAYGSLLWLLRNQVFQIFYGGKYSQYAGWPLFLVAVMPAGTCMTAVLGSGLRALERPDHMFWCYGVSVISAVAIGIPLAARHGLIGALVGLLVSSVVTISMMAWFYARAVLAKAPDWRQKEVVEQL